MDNTQPLISSRTTRRRLLRLLGVAVTTTGVVAAGTTAQQPTVLAQSSGIETSDEDTSYTAAVRQARSTQRSLIRSPLICSADETGLAAVDRAEGDQIRLYRDGEVAVYTVTETRTEPADAIVRLGLGGRRRLGTTESFDGVVESTVPHPELSESEAREQNEFIEHLSDADEATVAVLSPHGGTISPKTAGQADTVVDELSMAATRWGCKGWWDEGNSFDRWFVSSHDISTNSFPALAEISDRGFEYVVSFRGLDDQGVYVSGYADDDFVTEIVDEIESIVDGVPVVSEGRPAAARPDNGPVAHRLAAAGGSSVWIGQDRTVREDHGDEIATAVASVIEEMAE